MASASGRSGRKVSRDTYGDRAPERSGGPFVGCRHRGFERRKPTRLASSLRTVAENSGGGRPPLPSRAGRRLGAGTGRSRRWSSACTGDVSPAGSQTESPELVGTRMQDTKRVLVVAAHDYELMISERFGRQPLRCRVSPGVRPSASMLRARSAAGYEIARRPEGSGGFRTSARFAIRRSAPTTDRP
jgi:hypothetical protein